VGAAAERVWARLPDGAREVLAGLAPTDLQSLLIDLAEERAAGTTARDVMARWRDDRFVQPATGDPRVSSAVERRIWELLPGQFEGVELSPVAPFGSCSVLGPVSQNRVLTTTRTSEVVSDPTNVLALEAARRQGDEVHLATCHRVLRTQDFGAGWSPHFRLAALVSAGRRHERDLLELHLTTWQTILDDLIPHERPRIRVTVFDRRVLPEQQRDEDPGRTKGRGYYKTAAIGIVAGDDEDLGDGGFTDWVAQLRQDAKQRCLISCVSVDRLAQRMREEPPSTGTDRPVR
jgi:hypothetical protein